MRLHWVFVAEHGLSLVAVGGLLIAEPSLVEHSLAGEPASVLRALHHQVPEPAHTHVHPAISSSVVPFSSCPQSFPAAGFFQMSQLFTSGGQSIRVSASASVLPMNTQD